MNRFLNTFLSSLSTSRQRSAASLLQEATVAKNQIDIIAAKLESQVNFVPLVLDEAQQHTVITAEQFSSNMRDLFNRITAMFSLSNQISVLLDSHQKLLGSDIKALEDQLVTMEKLANNYAFMMADGGSFDHAYIESFNDERGRDSFTWLVSDRAQQTFSPGEQATVRPAEGALVIPGEPSLTYPLTATIFKANASSFMTSDTGIQNAVTQTTDLGWRVAYATAHPITSSLPEVSGYIGAQVVLEFRLNKAAPASEMQLIPFADLPVQLIQLTTYSSDDDSIGISHFVTPVILDRALTIHIPLSLVSRFRLVINQSTYTRENANQNLPEEQHRLLWQQIATPPTLVGSAPGGVPSPVVSDQDSPASFNQEIIALAKAGNLPTPLASLDRTLRTHLGPYEVWNGFSVSNSVLLDFFSKNTKLFSEIFLRSARSNAPTPGLAPVTAAPPALSVPIQIQTGLSYQYDLGLKYVAIGTDPASSKGVFVSVTLPSDGDMGQVRLKVDDEQYSLPVTDRDSSVLTSIEYSVSNQSSPMTEANWIPILPVGTTLVEAERLLPDLAGVCILRFSADRNEQLNVYKNGYNFNDYTAKYDPSNNLIVGLQINLSAYAADDILTVRYFPVAGYDVVDFSSLGFSGAPLITTYDKDGAGEGFVMTQARNSIELHNVPFVHIDPATQALSTAPITVALSDGSFALNLTSYTPGSQVTMPATGGPYYLQSGNVLIFNRPINIPFRVYYQYLQNNVRVRVVLRVNSPNFVTPKVHSFQLKAKTRRPNPASSI